MSVKAMSELLSRWMHRRGVGIRVPPLSLSPSLSTPLISLALLTQDQAHPGLQAPDPEALDTREPDLRPVVAGDQGQTASKQVFGHRCW